MSAAARRSTRTRWAAAVCAALALGACSEDDALPAGVAVAEPAWAPALPPWPLHHDLELALRVAARQGAVVPAELPGAVTDVHVLVWRDRPDGGADTFWLQVQASPAQLAAANAAHDAGLAEPPLPVVQLLAQREGRWLPGRDGLWQWQTAQRRIRTCDPAACAEADARCVPVLQRAGPFQGRVNDARLVSATGGVVRPVGPRISDQAALALASPGFAQRIRLLGSLGSYHWLRTETEVWSCGGLVGHTAEADAQLLVPDGLLVGGLDAETVRQLVAADQATAQPTEPDAPMRQPSALTLQVVDGQWQAQLVWTAVSEVPLPGSLTPVDHVPLEVPLVEWPASLRDVWLLRPPLATLPLDPPVRAGRKREAQPISDPLRAGYGLVPAEPTVRARWFAAFARPVEPER